MPPPPSHRTGWGCLAIESGIAELFHENTKLRDHDCFSLRQSGPQRRNWQRQVEQLYDRRVQARKIYPHAERVDLPPCEERELPPFDAVIRQRRSRRDFSGAALEIADLSALLRWSHGITGSGKLPSGETLSYRAVASGGGMHPLEIYPIARNVEGLSTGVYHYDTHDGVLERIAGDLPEDPIASFMVDHEPGLSDAACVLAVSAVFSWQTAKYGDRGYRIALMDAGCLVQQLYLVATALDLRACAYAGFIDDKVNGLIGVDGFDEATLLLFAVGPSGGREGA